MVSPVELDSVVVLLELVPSVVVLLELVSLVEGSTLWVSLSVAAVVSLPVELVSLAVPDPVCDSLAAVDVLVSPELVGVVSAVEAVVVVVLDVSVVSPLLEPHAVTAIKLTRNVL